MNNKSVIKNHLKKYGGLYITNRQIGKTEAILELFHEHHESYLLVPSRKSCNNIIKKYKDKYNDGRENKIITIEDIKSDVEKTIENSYIDDYFNHNILYKKFKGAVGTMIFPIKITKFSQDFNQLTYEVNAMENTLEFNY